MTSTTFSWTPSVNVNISGSAAGTGATINNTLTNVTGTTQVIVYTVTPTGANGCQGDNFTVTVKVQPQPIFTISPNQEICSGSKTNILLNTATSGATIELINVTYSGVQGNLQAGQLFVNGQIIAEALTNSTNAPITVQYTFEAKIAGCPPSAPQSISVKVNPNPTFTITNLTPAICSGTSPNISVNSPTNGAIIQLKNVTYTNISGGVYSSGTSVGQSGSLTEGNLVNTNAANTGVAQQVTYTFGITTPSTSPVCPLTVNEQNTVVTVQAPIVVSISDLPDGSPIPDMAENELPVTITGSNRGGIFTISPSTSVIGSTYVGSNSRDAVVFDPSIVTVGTNVLTYTYTDNIGCSDSQSENILVNPVTNVDFIIANGTVNATQQWEVCSDQGLVKLTGNPIVGLGFPPETRFSSTPGFLHAATLPVVFQGGEYYLNTDGVISDIYYVRYTFRNAFDAVTYKEYAVKILASPVALINVSSACIQSAISFTDGSTIPTTPYPTILASWQWNFGAPENGSSSLQNPSFTYSAAGNKNVTLKVTTLQGCSNIATKAIRVGNAPAADFSWSAICNNESTRFQDKTVSVFSPIKEYTWNFGDGDIVTGPADGTIPPGANGGRTTGTYKTPNHQYVNFGTYTVQLQVLTVDGCTNALQQKVFILVYSTVTPLASAAYAEGFEGTNGGGWIPEAKTPSDTSWICMTPNGANIKSASTGSKAWWTGRNNNSYYAKENSVINGPCFDLRNLNRPMVSLDYWSDAETDVDGAVLQYSIDGGISWQIVGPPAGQQNRNEGISWFNSSAILSRPGDQTIGPYGWSSRTGKWITNARFNLDMIPLVERDQVRLRIAFASNDGNSAIYDGFAFDNFFVGDKLRNVLVEHFTNSASTLIGDDYLNTLYQEQFSFHSTSDFSDIRYHINVPGNDLLNQDNQADPAARALYFGVTLAPTTVMDGLLNDKFKGKFTDLNRVELDRRALEDPLFDLKLDTVPTGVNNKIKVNLTVTARQTVSTPLIVQVALVENTVGSFKNVLRKALFGSDGQTLINSFVAGQSTVTTNSSEEINVPIVNSNQLSLIAFVQNKSTKEIYQSIKIAAPIKKGAVVVGLEDEVTPTSLNGISVYPNPANGMFNFGVPNGNSTEGYSWKLADQRGVIVTSGNFEGSINGVKQVSVADLPNAVYFVIITGPGKSIVYRKLVVMNRH
jgi:PKD repeat protein